jgi:hypothetical protein
MTSQLGNACENSTLLLFFQNVNFANVGDAVGLRGSTTAGSFFISLQTANPGAGGSQTTSEAAYTSYARVAVARSSAGWTVSGSSPTQAANVAAVTFPLCTGGSETETFTIIGRDTSGAGEILWFGSLSSSLAVSNGITPSYAIGALVAQLL